MCKGILMDALLGTNSISNKYKIRDFAEIKLTGKEGQIVDMHVRSMELKLIKHIKGKGKLR